MSLSPSDLQADRYARDPNGRAARLIRPLRDFLHQEASAGLLLVGAAVAALIWANSPWSDSYFDLWNIEAGLEFNHHAIQLNLREWINDLAMVLFFFVVGTDARLGVLIGSLTAALIGSAICLRGQMLDDRSMDAHTSHHEDDPILQPGAATTTALSKID